MTPLEDIELACWTSLLTTADAREQGAEARAHAGGGMFRTPSVDHVMFNRSIGVPPSHWDAVDSWLSATGNRFFVHGIAGEDIVEHDTLTTYPRSWVKFEQQLSPVPWPDVPEGMQLRLATPDDAAELAEVFCAAFDLPETALPFIRALVGHPGWHCVVLSDGNRIAALGMLFVQGDIGYLAGGATRPSHRGRGAQRAVIEARLHLAAELGVQRMVTETGEAKPGEPQHSYRNLERCGFRQVGVRHNYCRPGTTWS